MPTSQLQACKDKAKSHIVSILLTLNICSLGENLNKVVYSNVVFYALLNQYTMVAYSDPLLYKL